MPVTVQADFGENGRCAASDRFGHWFHDDAGQRPLQRRPIEPRMRHFHDGGGTSDHPQIVGPCQCQPLGDLPRPQDRLRQPFAGNQPRS